MPLITEAESEGQEPAKPASADSPESRRFRVALSFPGEHRLFIEEVAEDLAASLGRERVLYDKFYEAEFARLDLDVYLPRLYRKQSELIVLFLCPEYAAKRWPRLEWRHIRQLIATVEDDRIMLTSFGSPGDLSEIGIMPGDGYVDIGNRPATEISHLILQRLESDAARRSSPLSPDVIVGSVLEQTSPALRGLRAKVRHRCTESLAGMISGDPYEVEMEWRDPLEGSAGEPQEKGKPLPAGGISELFADRDRLLLLGAPGSGKTVALRQLARDLAAHAKQVPVYLSLSHWVPNDKDFADWLASMLNKGFSCDPKDASKWIESDAVLPLLDDLDEVPPADRPACVVAINRHLEHHGGGLTAAARPVASEARRLSVQAEVVLKPLSEARAEAYLEAMERRPGSERYGRERTRRALAWLARKLTGDRFEIEQLQPSWLASPWLRWGVYAVLSRGLAGGLMAAVFLFAFPDYWLLPVSGLLAGALVGGIDALPAWKAPASGQPHGGFRQSAIRTLVLGAVAFAVFRSLPIRWGVSTLSSFILALVFGLVFGSRPGGLRGDARVFETLRWVWSWKRGFVGALCGVLVGVTFAVLVRIDNLADMDWRFFGLWLVLCIGLSAFGLLAGATIGGFRAFPEIRKSPSQGLRRLLYNSFLVACRVAGLFTLALWALVPLMGGRGGFTWENGAYKGVGIGLLAGFWFGGIDLLQHFLLRFLLSAAGPFPWRWVRFLDHAADCGLLSQVDGGYEFPYRVVREHFAKLPERS